tara:strand:- start:839 stop:1009 length:171 start_codon:yes stop_codon:yes gene_type:complete
MPAYKWSDDDEYGRGGRRPMKNRKRGKKKKGKRLYPKKQSDYRKQAGKKRVRRGRK